MTNWPADIVLAVAMPGAAISWVVSLVSHLRFAVEFRRAKRSGELFPAGRSLPLFKKNVLPRVEKDRVLAIRASLACIGFAVGGLAVGAAACAVWVCQN